VKADATDGAEDSGGGVLSIRVNPQYRDYLKRLAEHERVCVSALLDRAVADHAKLLKFPEAPPKR
jgi:tRNA (Thr-GGU) A37 N-methylase